ncbi:hypothetical protein M5K25_004050 [Dendrobium thyrsiflorum]|uniref:Dof-type domain-containing protein n=1 Tax=Dendrobium thyrsiflorum TaxID=117978 RepID=A0ABD0VLR2_DENTH
MESVRDSSGFKLFGAVIATDKRSLAAAPEDDDVATEAAEEEEVDVAASLPCPRCKSQETKFCYFNNYNVNQPRHFCKACHRYWTAGGTLRNVPVGAGRRRNRIAPPELR